MNVFSHSYRNTFIHIPPFSSLLCPFCPELNDFPTSSLTAQRIQWYRRSRLHEEIQEKTPPLLLPLPSSLPCP